MDARELRIGNLVIGASRWEVVEVTSGIIKAIDESKAVYGPIELTEEKLLDFGFERFEMSDTEKSYSINLPRNRRLSIIILGESKLIQITSNSIKDPYIPIDFVCLFNEMYDGKLFIHKLQNIVYDLTGKEL